MTNTTSTVNAEPIDLFGPGVTIEDTVRVAREYAAVTLHHSAIERMQHSREIVEHLIETTPTYGLSTGFGALATTTIPVAQRAQLQKSLIRSHAASMGPPVANEIVRAMMFLRARTLALGFSGARPILAQTMLGMLNAKITPLVQEHGSLGASGDLAPLAHVALSMMGEGEVDTDGQLMPAGRALASAGIEPVEPAEKEGLSLTNGTDGILAMLCLSVHDSALLLNHADMVTAHSVEALMATDRAFAADLQALRPHVGQALSAANLREWLAGSEILTSHRTDDLRVQDAYSIRCSPQVHGAARDTLEHVRTVVQTELGSAIDNPMVLPDGRVESCGNFHGAPLGFAADFLAIAIAELGAISERRLDRILDAHRSHGLNPFLAANPGVDSGLMIGQYTAAAMCAENRRLAAPASVDSLPTSAMQEDHVSMAWGAASKLRKIIDNTRRILAIEWVTAARGIDLRAPLSASPRVAEAITALREEVPGPGPDRYLSPELRRAEELLKEAELTRLVDRDIPAA